jgi:hypothetical protein
MNELQAQEWKVGQHSICFEPPDVVTIVFVGDVSGPEMSAINDKPRELFDKEEYFSILNLEKLGSFSAEAKQKIRESPLTKGVAAFGASFQTKIVISLLSKVYSMLYRGGAAPVFFAATGAEARAWIEARRQTLADEKTKGSSSK